MIGAGTGAPVAITGDAADERSVERGAIGMGR